MATFQFIHDTEIGFHVIFMCHKIFFFYVKSILSSQDYTQTRFDPPATVCQPLQRAVWSTLSRKRKSCVIVVPCNKVFFLLLSMLFCFKNKKNAEEFQKSKSFKTIYLPTNTFFSLVSNQAYTKWPNLCLRYSRKMVIPHNPQMVFGSNPLFWHWYE